MFSFLFKNIFLYLDTLYLKFDNIDNIDKYFFFSMLDLKSNKFYKY